MSCWRSDLTEPKGPSLLMRDTPLTPGTTSAAVVKVLGVGYRPCEFAAVGIVYRYYPEQGIAVRLVLDTVTEVVVVQVPGQ